MCLIWRARRAAPRVHTESAISAFFLFRWCCRESIPASLTHAMMQSGHSQHRSMVLCGVRNTKTRFAYPISIQLRQTFSVRIRLLWWCRVERGIWHCCRRMLIHEFLFSNETNSTIDKEMAENVYYFCFPQLLSIELLGGAIERYRIDAQYIHMHSVVKALNSLHEENNRKRTDNLSQFRLVFFVSFLCLLRSIPAVYHIRSQWMRSGLCSRWYSEWHFRMQSVFFLLPFCVSLFDAVLFWNIVEWRWAQIQFNFRKAQ